MTKTVTLRPADDGDFTEILHVSGAEHHWEAVDEEVADGDTTTIWNSVSTFKVDTFKHGGFSGSGHITAVRVYYRVRGQTDASWFKSAILTRDNLYYSSEHYYASGPGSYTTLSDSWATNPAGGDWAWADITALQFGVAMRAGGGGFKFCTQVYCEVDFEPEPGGANVGVGGAGGGGMIF